jgi:hypothetical protein
MKRIIIVAAMALLMLGLTAAPAFAAWDYKATGDAYALNPSNNPYTYTLATMANDAGAAKGFVTITSATGWWTGEVEVLQQVGNMAAFTGHVVAASDPTLVGQPYVSAVQDNGEGSNATAVDRIFAYRNQTLSDYSMETMLNSDFFLNKGTLVAGNIQVH